MSPILAHEKNIIYIGLIFKISPSFGDFGLEKRFLVLLIEQSSMGIHRISALKI